MFLVRAVFWLTVVALLMPREPDVGLGVPGAADGLASTAAMPDCNDYQAACELGLQVADRLQSAALTGLAQIKTEIERQKREREDL